MKHKHMFIAVVIALCSASALIAQTSADTTTVVEIEKNDRSIIVGRIISNDAKEVVVSTAGTRIYVPKHEIRRIGPSAADAPQAMSGDELGQAPFGSYYGFTQGALPHASQQGHIQITPLSTDFELYLTNRLSVGLMSSVFAAPIIGRTSYTFSSNNDLHFSAGGFVGWGGSIARTNAIAMPTVSITKGDSRNNISLSAGYGYSTFMQEVTRFDGEYQRVDYVTGELVTDTLASTTDVRLNTTRAWLSIGLIVEVSRTISFVLDGFCISEAGTSKLPTDQVYLDVIEGYDLDGRWDRNYRVVSETQTYSTIIISPSIRWKMSAKSSLQFGFTGYKGNFLNLEDNSNWTPLPIPMVQWFIKL